MQARAPTTSAASRARVAKKWEGTDSDSRRGQRFIVQAHDPQMIESQAGGFQHAHHLHRRAFVLHLERCGSGDIFQTRQGLPKAHRRGGQVERGEAREQTEPGLQHLMLATVEDPVARPSDRFQELREIAAPGAQVAAPTGSLSTVLSSRRRDRCSRGQSPAASRKYDTLTSHTPFFRSFASSSARLVHSVSAPAKNGDRSNIPARGSVTGPSANSRASNAACTRGYSSNAGPSDR